MGRTSSVILALFAMVLAACASNLQAKMPMATRPAPRIGTTRPKFVLGLQLLPLSRTRVVQSAPLDERDELFQRIHARISARPGGTVTKHFLLVLTLGAT